MWLTCIYLRLHVTENISTTYGTGSDIAVGRASDSGVVDPGSIP